MTDLRTAAQRVVWEYQEGHLGWPLKEAITALEAALAEHDKNREWFLERKANWDLQRKLAEETQERDRQQSKYEEARLAALAEPVQEPVAWHYTNNGGSNVMHWGPSARLDADIQAAKDYPHVHKVQPLYTAPPQRKPLTHHQGGNMNREDVIKLMLQTEPEMAVRVEDHEEGLEGFTGEDPKLLNFWPFENYVKFAHLVYESVFRDANLAASRTILDAAVLEEREACAKTVEIFDKTFQTGGGIAGSIRARGKHDKG